VNFLPCEYDIIKQNSPRAQRTLLFSSLDIAEIVAILLGGFAVWKTKRSRNFI